MSGISLFELPLLRLKIGRLFRPAQDRKAGNADYA
jgi:hypothetical protein